MEHSHWCKRVHDGKFICTRLVSAASVTPDEEQSPWILMNVRWGHVLYSDVKGGKYSPQRMFVNLSTVGRNFSLVCVLAHSWRRL